MKLVSVQIDQFGQFTDQRFDFPDESFMIIQGENETGKSTLVRFIKYMLFGFPTRSALRSLGLLNGNDSLIGGRLELKLPSGEGLSLIRHLRKFDGQATLYLKDGTIKGEDVLKTWLHGLDLSLYEAIFSIDLEGLRNLHRLKPETLQHYLFSTGMMGNSKILELERKLEKEAGERFKPNGKLPVLNQTLQKLDQLQEKLAAWDKKWETYLSLKEEKTGCLNKIDRIRAQRANLLEERQTFTEYKAIEPNLIRYQALKDELAAFSPSLDHFPKEGRERYESWRTQLVTLEAERTDIAHQIEELENGINQLNEQIDERWVNEQEVIQEFIQKGSPLQANQLETAKLKERLEIEKKEWRLILDQLDTEASLKLADRDIQGMETGIQLKHHLKLSQKEIHRLDQELAFIQREITTFHQEIEELKNQSNPSPPLTQVEREEAKRVDQLFKRTEARQHEQTWIERNLQTAKKQSRIYQRVNTFSNGAAMILMIVSLILIAGIGGGFHQTWGEWFGGALLILACLSWLGLRFLLKILKQSFSKVSHLERRYQELKGEDEKLRQNQHLLDKYKEEQKFIEQQKRVEETTFALKEKMSLRQKEFAETEAFKQSRLKALQDVLHEKGYPIITELSLALDYIELVEKAKQKLDAISSIEKQLAKFQKEKQTFEANFTELKTRLGKPKASLEEVKVTLERIDLLVGRRDRLNQNLTLLVKQLHSFNEKIARFQKECYNLWQQAQVSSEEEFYKMAALWQKEQGRQLELEELTQSLRTIFPEQTKFELFLNWFKMKKWEKVSLLNLNEHLRTLEESLQTEGKHLEDLNVLIRQVEEDDQQADLVHQYEGLRDQLRKEAREWAVYKTALGLLAEAKATYKAKRLPRLLETSQRLFNQVTNGTYTGLYYQEAEGFTVEHKDGPIFKVEELSRGTAEQLYVALRLALINLYETEFPLPILIDDGFVNFDPIRLKQMMETLNTLSSNHQVILLTCQSSQIETVRMEEWKEKGRKVANGS